MRAARWIHPSCGNPANGPDSKETIEQGDDDERRRRDGGASRGEKVYSSGPGSFRTFHGKSDMNEHLDRYIIS